MIEGIQTTQLGREVVASFLRDEPHPVKVSYRGLVMLTAGCCTPFADWHRINEAFNWSAKSRDLINTLLTLEKLQLIKVYRPAKVGHTKFGFDREGRHQWLP